MLLRNSENSDEFVEFINSSDAIFHYTKKTTSLENILPNKTIKFGVFSRTNDPQEYRPKLTGAVGWGWEDESNEVSDTLKEIELLCKSRSLFLSFCQNTFDEGELSENGLLKSRMWAQYGDNHEGACIVFSKSKLIKLLGSQITNTQEILIESVSYINPERRKQPILHVDQSDFLKATSNDIALDFLRKHKKALLFSKQTDYRDECEFRVVMVNKSPGLPNESESFINASNAIEGVVFGDRFPRVYTPTINALLSGSDICARKLYWHKTGYHLMRLQRE